MSSEVLVPTALESSLSELSESSGSTSDPSRSPGSSIMAMVQYGPGPVAPVVVNIWSRWLGGSKSGSDELNGSGQILLAN